MGSCTHKARKPGLNTTTRSRHAGCALLTTYDAKSMSTNVTRTSLPTTSIGSGSSGPHAVNTSAPSCVVPEYTCTPSGWHVEKCTLSNHRCTVCEAAPLMSQEQDAGAVNMSMPPIAMVPLPSGNETGDVAGSHAAVRRGTQHARKQSPVSRRASDNTAHTPNHTHGRGRHPCCKPGGPTGSGTAGRRRKAAPTLLAPASAFPHRMTTSTESTRPIRQPDSRQPQLSMRQQRKRGRREFSAQVARRTRRHHGTRTVHGALEAHFKARRVAGKRVVQADHHLLTMRRAFATVRRAGATRRHQHRRPGFAVQYLDVVLGRNGCVCVSTVHARGGTTTRDAHAGTPRQCLRAGSS